MHINELIKLIEIEFDDFTEKASHDYMDLPDELIKNRELLKYFEIYYKLFFNGLQRYSCEINIYTPENKFYVTPPQFSRDSCYNYWDIGYIDLKNMLFYEMSLLLSNPVPRLLFFEDWINFLQFISDNK